MRSILLQSLFAILLWSFGSSCAGYKFRSAETSALKEDGINRIFFKGVKNDTQKTGIEHLIATGLKEKLQSSGGIKIVYDESEADALLEARILKADTHAVILTPSASLYPPSNISVAKARIGSEYEAILGCEYTLKKTERTIGGLSREDLKRVNENAIQSSIQESFGDANTRENLKWNTHSLGEKKDVPLAILEKGAEKIIFLRSFQNSRRYLGSNQKGSYGTTSALISESEFDRALEELTKTQMREVQESLLSRF